MDIYPHHLATWSRDTLEAAIRRRVQTAYLGNDTVLARILGRHKIFLRGSDRGFACHLMLDGFWEMWLTQFVARQIKPGMTVIDVGANFGYYTLLFGDAVGESGRVIAVEPNPDTASFLRESVTLNGHGTRTQIVAHALAAAAGRAWLHAPDDEPKNARLVAEKGLPGGRTIEVSTLPLDDLALPYAKVDLVKIDAEGGELAIVPGMRGLIARDHPIIILEFKASRYPSPGEFLGELVAAYGSAQELTFESTLAPLNLESALDPASDDRLLVFGL